MKRTLALSLLVLAGCGSSAASASHRISSVGVSLRVPRNWYASTARTSGCDPRRLTAVSSSPFQINEGGALRAPAPREVEIVVLEDHQRRDRPIGNLQRPSQFAIDWNHRITVQGCPDGLHTAVYSRWFKQRGRYLGLTVYAGSSVTKPVRALTVAILDSLAVGS